MKHYVIDPNFPDIDILKEAASILKRGGVVAYPTDTVYGLAVNALREDAVAHLFKIKKRPEKKPVPVIVKDLAMAKKLAYIDDKKEKILKAVWPGKVTVVLEKKDIVPDILTAYQKTVGLRIPNYSLIFDLLELLDFPITSTSANISGEEPISDANEIIKIFKKEHPSPDLILDAGQLPQSEPSTVLDLSGPKPKILRVGPTNPQDLMKLLEM